MSITHVGVIVPNRMREWERCSHGSILEDLVMCACNILQTFRKLKQTDNRDATHTGTSSQAMLRTSVDLRSSGGKGKQERTGNETNLLVGVVLLLKTKT